MSANPEKVCPACNTEHPLSAFGRDRRTHDGYRLLCRACRRERRTTRNLVRRNLKRIATATKEVPK